ncbi:MAG: enoyl-CoA hydratase/isomerase family protein [Desulfobacterales bacterium]
MAYENLLFTVDDGIATITFNRPKALNALNSALLAEFSEALDAVEADMSVRVLILTGAGEKSFVAGADITEINKLNALQAKQFARKGQDAISRLQDLPIPVIAAVNGFALGGGCEMALASDFVYAAENARFGLPEINLGIIPGFGGTQRLPRRVSPARAKELIFTGNMLTADEAERIGLVNRVLPADRLLEETRKTAGVIASKGRVSLRAAKQVVNTGLNVDLGSGLVFEAEAFALCVSSEDAREGTSAFLEKRKAEFKGTFES